MTFIPQIEPYLTEAEQRAIQEYLTAGGWLTEHKATRELEQLVAHTIGARHVVAVPNGTIGLYLALQATLPIGSLVAVPAYTMVATINAVLWAGMTPLVVDIDPATGCLDLDALTRAKRKVDALIYVALNGRTGNMLTVSNYCFSNNIVLIEDACQAFMSAYGYQMCGTFGKVGVFSLSPHKVITTGQGGLIATNDDNCFRKIKLLKDFGRDQQGIDVHQHYGLNFKFTDLQAVIGIQQLNIINYRIRKKLSIFESYQKALPKTMSMLPLLGGNVPWFVDVLCQDSDTRDRLAIYLHNRGIGTRKFYPVLYQQPFLQHFSNQKAPHAENFSARGIWLPSSIGLTELQLTHIFTCLNNFQ